MRLLLQRVKHASVDVAGTRVAAINYGLLALVGFGPKDGPELPHQPLWKSLLDKMLDLRVFPDAQQKMNLSLMEYTDVATMAPSQLLLVPQFTLYADCRRGRRPSFQDAAAPPLAAQLFEHAVAYCGHRLPQRTFAGIFGADMDVQLLNWGPVTIFLESAQFQS